MGEAAFLFEAGAALLVERALVRQQALTWAARRILSSSQAPRNAAS
jgi:hypothetical protein